MAYISPEQLRGEVDERGDVFSLGVLLYECLTDRLPFRGETWVDIQYAILRESPTPLRSLAPEISPAGEQLVERCLEKQVEKRFASMAEVLEAMLSDKEKGVIEKVPTANVKAYGYYLRGRQFFHQF